MKVLIAQQVGPLCGMDEVSSSSCFGNVFLIEFVKCVTDGEAATT